MTDKRYTDEEIIKALEYCNADRNECDKCVFQRECESNPFYSAVAEHALDLINRQRAEIERLQKEVNLVSIQFQDVQERAEEYKLKIENLQNVISNQQIEISAKIEKQIKTEAYKEFAERIRECCDLNNDLSTDAWLSVTADINCVLKEMTGEQ